MSLLVSSLRPSLLAIAMTAGASLLNGCSSSVEGHSAEFEQAKELNKSVVERYLEAAKLELLSLTAQNMENCVAGQVEIAHSLYNQTEQEFFGHMYNDAFITLTKFDRQVRKIYCIHNYLDGKFGCAQSNRTVVLRDWYRSGDYQQCQAHEESVVKTDTAAAVYADTTLAKPIAPAPHTIITETLHDFDQETIKPIYYPALDRLVTLMMDYPASTLFIAGHADSKGTNEYNLILSEKRAQNLFSYFTERGIEATRIGYEALGENAPRVSEFKTGQAVFNRYTTLYLTLDTRIAQQSPEASYE
ncbi:MAG: OmpA family protein [Thalassotalea sp.]|nr:OmpA family protein [Thalassotalea sp.]